MNSHQLYQLYLIPYWARFLSDGEDTMSDFLIPQSSAQYPINTTLNNTINNSIDNKFLYP